MFSACCSCILLWLIQFLCALCLHGRHTHRAEQGNSAFTGVPSLKEENVWFVGGMPLEDQICHCTHLLQHTLDREFVFDVLGKIVGTFAVITI